MGKHKILTKKVKVNNKNYNPISILKLTTAEGFNSKKLSSSGIKFLDKLKKEAELNHFKVKINREFLT